MKILKYKKSKGNKYKIITDDKEYNLYDDIIIKHELLLKKEIDDKVFAKVLEENNLYKAYYAGLKAISTKLRTEKEIASILRKKDFNSKEIEYAVNRLEKEGYLKHEVYIEAFIHDMINLNLVGETKILDMLLKQGFREEEVKVFLDKIDEKIYRDKIDKYIKKKLKSNKKSSFEFKRKIGAELINKGFNKEDILASLEKVHIEDDILEIKKIIDKQYNKYIKKYDQNTAKMKVKSYLYQKGYTNIDEYI